MTIARARKLFGHREVRPFGPMHITVEDGNVDDDHLDFVEEEMKKVPCPEVERELLRVLRSLSIEDRRKAWRDD